jgi:hypothetical protein
MYACVRGPFRVKCMYRLLRKIRSAVHTDNTGTRVRPKRIIILCCCYVLYIHRKYILCLHVLCVYFLQNTVWKDVFYYPIFFLLCMWIYYRKRYTLTPPTHSRCATRVYSVMLVNFVYGLCLPLTVLNTSG